MAENQDPRVECYSGSRYGERPLSIYYQDKRHIVAAIIRQWRTPEGLYYQVITEEELRFDLIYLDEQEEWQIIPHDE